MLMRVLLMGRSDFAAVFAVPLPTPSEPRSRLSSAGLYTSSAPQFSTVRAMRWRCGDAYQVQDRTARQDVSTGSAGGRLAVLLDTRDPQVPYDSGMYHDESINDIK